MRFKIVTIWLLGTAVLVAFAAPAMAQARPSSTPAASSASSADDTGTFGIGYSYLHIISETAGAGFDAFYTKDVSTMNSGSIGYVVDFSVNHSGGLGTAEFIDGGARINFKGHMKAKIYGQVTAGYSHFSSASEGLSQFVIDFGGGVNYPIPDKKLAVFAQIDFPVVFFQGGNNTGLRLNLGVTLPVGK